MSELAVQDFLKATAGNPGLVEKITAAVAGRSQSEAGEAIAALGAEQGFSFTGQEALAVRDQLLSSIERARERREEAILAGVRGGSGNTVSQDQLNTMQTSMDAGASAATGAPGIVGAVVVAATVATAESAANGENWVDTFSNALAGTEQSTAPMADDAAHSIAGWISNW